MKTTIIGLDLGALQDFSARAELRVIAPPVPPAPDPVTFHPAAGGKPTTLPAPTPAWGSVAPPAVKAPEEPTRLRCVGLYRWPLKTRYATVVNDIGAHLDRLRAAGEDVELVIDGTGVGVAVLELFDAAGIRYTAVSIHGGQATTHEGKVWRVAKKSLVAALQVAAQNRTLTIDRPKSELAQALRAEMGNFRHTINPATAHESFAAWRESDHDDLVLALALACWRATRPVKRVGAW